MQELITDLDVIRRMSPEELREWVLWEPEPTPLSAFPLHSHEGRCGFLREFYMVGEGALFSAVAHIWSSLEEPRTVRCIKMGLAAGTGGSGKRALRKLLQKFFQEALSIDNPLPPRAAYESLQSWHEASMASFQQDEADLAALVEIYAAQLNCGSLE
jgi:hypothetical protein